MSLILDALNRSREDVGGVPGLDTAHALPVETRRPVASLLLGGALLLAFGVIAWLLLRPAAQTTPATPAPIATPAPATESAAVPVPAQAAAAPVARQEAAGQQAPAAPQPEARQAEPAIAGAAALGEAAALESGAAEQADTPAAGSTAAPADPAIAALYGPDDDSGESTVLEAPEPAAQAQPSAPAPVQPAQAKDAPSGAPTASEEGVDIDALVRRAQAEIANAELAEHPAPFVGSLSQQTKDAIPTLLYSAHDYSGKPGQSSVVINGRQLRVGGSPATGIKIDEILPDSVVLSFQGKQFRLRALNSWVNL